MSRIIKVPPENRILNRKLQKYQILADEAREIMLFFDLKGNILDANQSAIENYGYSYEELLTLNVSDLRREKDKNIIETEMKVAEDKGILFETVHYRKDGSAFHVEVSWQGAMFEDNKIIISVIRDINERVKSQEALLASEVRYRRLFESAKDGILILNMDTGEIDDVNPYLVEMLGYSKEELIQKKVWEIESLKDILISKESFLNLQSKGYIRYENIPLLTAKGQQMEVELVSNVYSENERSVIQCNIRDITERRKSEATIAHLASFPRLNTDLIIELNLDGSLNYSNPTVLNLFPDLESLSTRHPLLANWKTAMEQLSAQGTDSLMREIMIGDCFYSQTLQYIESSKTIRIYSRDITGCKRAEEDLKESEKKYHNYIENAPDGVIVIDETGHYLEVNSAACEITGYSREELLHMTIMEILAEKSPVNGVNHFKKLLEEGNARGILQYRHKNGAKRWWSVDAVKLSENRFLGFVRDMTDQKKAEEDLVHLGYHDSLTGLYNRAFFEEELKRIKADRQKPLCVIIGDINGVKLINDSFGHETGDKTIIEVAKIIKSSSNEENNVFRIGGDEFCIILPDSNEKQANNICQLIYKKCRNENEKSPDNPLFLSISLGYSLRKTPEDKVESMIKEAEAMMYRHKLLETRSLRSSIVSSIMSTLKDRYIDSNAHSERMKKYCRAIGEHLGLSEALQDNLQLLAMLHDIGKISISDAIINKNAKLTKEEMDEIKRHCEFGYLITQATTEFQQISEFILAHHEKWDGTGYPRQLKGEEIPILSRIISVVDSYDAMTNHRPYRQTMTEEHAAKEIIRCSATQFDPQIVRVFTEKVLGKK